MENKLSYSSISVDLLSIQLWAGINMAVSFVDYSGKRSNKES